MRSKIWSEIIVFVCFCIIAKNSVVCINFGSDDDPVGMGLLGVPDSSSGSFGSFGDLMPPNFAEYFSMGKENADNSDDVSRYNKGKAEDDNGQDLRHNIGNVFDSSPAKNIFDVLRFASDIGEVYDSNEQPFENMDDDDDDDDDEVKRQSMVLNREISSSWDKSSDWENDRMLGKAASMKDSISRLIGIGHKSSTASPDEADGESSIREKDDDDDDESEDGESSEKTTKMDGKSKGNIFTKWFSKSKTTSSDSDQKATTQASNTKLTAEESFASNSTTVKDDDEEDDDDDDQVEREHNSTSQTSTTKASASTTVTPLSSSTTDSTSTTSATKKGKSHKHKTSLSTSTTPEPDDISTTEKVTKKHYHHHHHHHHHRHRHTSTTPKPSTTLVHQSTHKHSQTTMYMNRTETDEDDDNDDNDENKTDHKSSSEIIEDFLASLGHKKDETKDNHTSTEAPATKSSKHPKSHKKKHWKSKHKKSTTITPELSSTANSENKSTIDTEVVTTIRPKGDTTTANLTSTTDSSASFPIISITRSTSDTKHLTTANSESTPTTEIPTLGPYVDELDDILPTEKIVYSDWNPDVFP